MTKCKNGYRRFYQFYSCCSHYYLLKETFAAETDPVYDKIIQKEN